MAGNKALYNNCFLSCEDRFARTGGKSNKKVESADGLYYHGSRFWIPHMSRFGRAAATVLSSIPIISMIRMLTTPGSTGFSRFRPA